MKRLSAIVKMHLEKARDSVLLAVEVYNKPAVSFKSAAYITLMNIGWTALFHAVFFNRKIKPFYRDENGIKYKRIDGDFKHWELNECLNQYYKSDTENPIRKNIEFFIPLRNKIEHRHLPELDSNIFAECQSLLLNFDELIESEFGSEFCLRESLSFALQMFPSKENFNKVVKRNKEYDEIINFVNNYRSLLSSDIINSGKYSFKAYLIKVANHQSKDALPIQFINYDELSVEQKDSMSQFIVAIKEKHISISNIGLLKPNQVIKKVQEYIKVNELSIKFTQDTHTRCYKKYKIRPSGKSKKPEKTQSEYCIYDALNGNYGYTEKWVKFLIEKISDDSEYQSIIIFRE